VSDAKIRRAVVLYCKSGAAEMHPNAEWTGVERTQQEPSSDEEPRMGYEYRVGRTPRADGPTKNVTFRLSRAEEAALRAHVARSPGSKSALIRDALERAGLLTPPPVLEPGSELESDPRA
jgi:hypothetical protein